MAAAALVGKKAEGMAIGFSLALSIYVISHHAGYSLDETSLVQNSGWMGMPSMAVRSL